MRAIPGRDRWQPSKAAPVVAALIVFGACGTPFGNTDKGSIRATVVDENNLGIPGVLLTTPLSIQFRTSYTDSAWTATDGTASFSIVETGSVPVTVVPNASSTATSDPLTKNVQVVKAQTSEVRFALRRR